MIMWIHTWIDVDGTCLADGETWPCKHIRFMNRMTGLVHVESWTFTWEGRLRLPPLTMPPLYPDYVPEDWL